MYTTLDFGRRLVIRKMSITQIWIALFGKIWRADASLLCVDNTRPKLETFLRDVIVVMNKDVYITRMSQT